MSKFLGNRLRVGVAIPSTNTSAQPEMDDMRPPGVTNHVGRMIIDDDSLTDERGFIRVVESIRAATPSAVASLRHCEAAAVIVAVSPDAYWSGQAAHKQLLRQLTETAGGAQIIMSADAIRAALNALGGLTRIGLISPYLELGDEPISRFFTESGFDVVAVHGLGGRTPSNISDVTPWHLRNAVIDVDRPAVEAIVQVGTNVPMAAFAPFAEAWIGKPVISNNAALYWHALRTCGVIDSIPRMGMLYERH